MQTHRPLAAAAWMSGSVLSFTAMAVAGRAVAGRHDTFEIMLWRSLVGLCLVLLAAGATGRLREIRRDRLGQHLLRNGVHFVGQNLWLYALTAIPLAQLFALEFTQPIWVVLLAPLLLDERLTPARALTAALGFAGAMIVARPDLTAPDAGMLAAAGAALSFAATAILTKALTRGESIVSILFWLTLMQSGLGLAAAGWDGAVALPTATTLPWLVLIGASGVFAHFCLTTALSLAPASFVIPIDFARLPLIAVIGATLYAEPLDPLVLLGAVVILAANALNIRAAGAARTQPLRNEIVTPRN
ncbi:MAG: DMT family transporter [Gemmobacter sp.]|jgi:drug/metabolite transporter (DMT)-like permease|nr:DMT family transporter [Gemmobacter sp.]